MWIFGLTKDGRAWPILIFHLGALSSQPSFAQAYTLSPALDFLGLRFCVGTGVGIVHALVTTTNSGVKGCGHASCLSTWSYFAVSS